MIIWFIERYCLWVYCLGWWNFFPYKSSTANITSGSKTHEQTIIANRLVTSLKFCVNNVIAEKKPTRKDLIKYVFIFLIFLSDINKNTFYKPVRSNTHTYTPKYCYYLFFTVVHGVGFFGSGIQCVGYISCPLDGYTYHLLCIGGFSNTC